MSNTYDISIPMNGDVIRNRKSAIDNRTKISKLVSATLEGDLGAFEILVNTYQTRIVNLAFRLTDNVEDAKDITQDVFIKVFHSLSRFNNEGKFYTWLYRIAVNTTYDFLRKRGRFRIAHLEESLPVHTEQDIERQNLDKEFVDNICVLLNHLSTPQKMSFILREVEGFSCKETAKILDCPEGTVRSHLFHTRKFLREQLTMNYPDLLEGTNYEV